MSAAERLLYLLKSLGPVTTQTLAERQGTTAMGARKHLLALREQGLVDCEQRAEGVGRPAQYWSLTGAGHARFPDRHGELTVQLLGNVRELFGEAGLERLISARETSAEQGYLAKLAGSANLAERLARLAAIRCKEGYMAELIEEEGGWLLIENHCPICAAATSCQGFCRSELALFRRCVGEDASVERIEHLLAGARRCAYRVRPSR
ncbi:transcriptional regulator [Neisseriaceae bacterium JH1-16]|nr:transcriptional regulator [Neisseriaceae bacterium JH1-16]